AGSDLRQCREVAPAPGLVAVGGEIEKGHAAPRETAIRGRKLMKLTLCRGGAPPPDRYPRVASDRNGRKSAMGANKARTTACRKVDSPLTRRSPHSLRALTRGRAPGRRSGRFGRRRGRGRNRARPGRAGAGSG